MASSRLEQAQHFELLLEVGKLLSSKLDLSELLHAVMQLAARVVNAETASLLLLDPETNELYFDVALGLDPALQKVRLKLGEGIAGTCAKDGAPMVINDVHKDPRWSSKMDKDSGFVTRSILATPILLRGNVIGVVEAINHIDGDFTETDVKIFEAFASQAAVSIENARLFASLREEKSKLDRLVNEMDEAAVLTNRKGEVIVANAAAQAFLGNAPKALIDHAFKGMELSVPLETLKSASEGMQAFDAVRAEPKRLVLAGSVGAVQDEEDALAGHVWVFRDVTDERREEGLKRNFLSLISHKLKTPLASITGYSQLLLDENGEKKVSDFQRNALNAVSQQGQKLSLLVNKLLNYTVLEDLENSEITLRPFPLKNLLKEAADSLASLIQERKAEVAIECPDGLEGMGDALLLRDAFRNIIENAVKFGDKEKIQVKVSVQSAQGKTVLKFTDNGPGIPPEERERIFNRFYQVESSFTGQIEGWGLGLSFSQKVIEKLGGTIACEESGGTTFVVTIPAPAP